MGTQWSYVVGVDIGGTFTDAALIDVKSGEVHIAKALNRYDLAGTVLEAVELAARQAGLDVQELLPRTMKFAHGTTLTTNVMYTWSGARTGLLTTAGFGDEILIMRARGRVAGKGLADRRHYRNTDKPPPIVPKQLIEEVAERVDYRGEVLVPLTRAEAERAVTKLLDQGVEAVAIALLWSPANPAHELALEQIIHERAPGVYVTLSHRIAPALSEYERTVSAVVNSYCGPTVSQYLDDLAARLASGGLAKPLLVLQANGGAAQVEETFPLHTIESGPAVGMVAMKAVAATAGYPNVIATDVGGTTFKVGLLLDGQWSLATETVVNQYTMLLPMIDVFSIGAGGGSIAWVDDVRLRIGPRSAGAEPGPAGYGWGGNEPTVTDADIVLGFIDPEKLLGGRFRVRPDLAEEAIRTRVADRLFDGDVLQAAAGIRRIVDAQMADLIRKATIQRGYDPRDFVLVAYGGAGPIHACSYARDIGVQAVMVPFGAAAFSALGAAFSDIQHSYFRSVPGDLQENIEAVGHAYAAMESQGRQALERQGVGPDRMRFARWADMQFERQLHDIRLQVPAGTVDARFVQALAEAFTAQYATLYGPGATLPGARVKVLRVGLEATGLIQKPALPDFPPGGPEPDPTAVLPGRRVFWPEEGGWLDTRVWDGLRLRPKNGVSGPAIIELPGTGIAIPPGALAEIDVHGNCIIHLTAGGANA